MFNNKTGGSSTPEAPARKSAAAPAARSASTHPPSILGRDIVITGDIKSEGDVQVDGRLDGNVTAGSITIGEQGAVNGVVSATIVHVRGKVTGKIDANTIELAETANVQADLIQDQLMISNGAFFDGKCQRKSAAPTPIKAQKSA